MASKPTRHCIRERRLFQASSPRGEALSQRHCQCSTATKKGCQKHKQRISRSSIDIDVGVAARHALRPKTQQESPHEFEDTMGPAQNPTIFPIHHPQNKTNTQLKDIAASPPPPSPNPETPNPPTPNPIPSSTTTSRGC